MTVTVVYDNSEATELCAAQHLYLKPIAKLMINVLLPECIEPVRPFSNWEVLDQLKSLICPDQFTTVRLSKSTKDFIRFEGEAETRSLVQILKAKLHGKIIKLNGLKTDLKVVATDAQGEWEHFPKEKEALVTAGAEEHDLGKSPDSIYFEGLPCKWFAPKGSSGEKPCEEILRVVFESFGKIKNVDIPMLDPYREVMTGGSFGGFNFGLQTFEAFIQYQESTDFIKAMESLRGMKLMLKGDDGKALACNIKVMFDTTQHFSEGAIQRRNQERLKLQELEEERKKEKKREEEVAERKRKDEVRKAQEKRKKARDRRRALKERDRHRQRKEKVKAKAEATQELDSTEEWEERKYLLAQRRVEALRLLRVLLKKIAGSTQCNPQEVDAMKPEAHHTPEAASKPPDKEELNTPQLLDQEETPSNQAPKSDSKQKQKAKKRMKAPLQKSSHRPGMKQVRYSTRKEETRKGLTDRCDYSVVSDQNSLQSTMNPDQSLEKEDLGSSNASHSSRKVVINHGRKQKIYETDEFIDYLLNYYQTPEYARFCLETNHLTSTCQWQRDVYATGDGFQVNLRKHRSHSTSLSEVEILEGKEQYQEQDWPNMYIKAPESKSEKTEKFSYAKEFTKKLKNHYKDIASETEDHLSPTDGENYPVEKIHSHRDSQHIRKSPVSSSLRSVDTGLPLADFLEEISSDSECFSETLSINEEEEERSVAVYNSSPEKRPLGTDKIVTCKQKTRSSQQTLYSEWKHDTEEKYSKHKVRAPGKRSKYELRYSWLKDECASIQVDRNISKSREKIAPKYMLDEGYYHESSSSDELENITRKRRRVTGTMFGQNLKYRPFHMPLMPPKRARAFYLGYFSRKRQNPWKSEYNQDVRRFKRYESSEDYMLDSGNYYVSHDDSQAHIEYGSYLGDSYSGSLYFKMF
ncbi:Akap17b [Phodopus roborovskii]|uniref:Akap17b protein n=1 Tax=Phodopus roborovskii TaxID=109678 RepID=A0AAU9YZE4_PHORO|nr:Akap17b [Phodopus roborovskii]